MDPLMGDMKSLTLYTNVWRAVVDIQYPQIHKKTVSNFTSRVFHEGIAFPTQVAPLLYKRTLAALEQGTRLEPMKEFSVDHAGRPHLFNELFSILFNEAGLPYDTLPDSSTNPSYPTLRERVNALQALNQLTMMLYKLRLKSTEEQKEVAWSGFKERNDACAVTYVDTETLIRARSLIRRILKGHSPTEIVPNHGSGSVAEGFDPLQRRKSLLKHWPDKLDAVFPYEEYAFLSLTHLCDEFPFDFHDKTAIKISKDTLIGNYTTKPTRKRPAKVAFVPKDSRGPRMICSEPSAHQFIQQGLMAKLMDAMEASTHPYTGCFPLRDQSIQHKRARLGSISGKFATLDMSAASDTVSHDIVWKLFPREWALAFDACRSEQVQYNNEVIDLSTFTPMGASICFPVECLVFWSIGAAQVRDPRQVTIFGDDLVVPTHVVARTLLALQESGFVPNIGKSYFRGAYRESCGEEYYHGYPVKAVFLRNLDSNEKGLEARRQFVNNIVAMYMASFADIDVWRPLRELIVAYDDYKVVVCSLTGAPTSFYAPFSSSSDKVRTRWNEHLQRSEMEISYQIPVVTRYTGWCRLHSSLLSRASRPSSYQKKARRTRLKTAWFPID